MSAARHITILKELHEKVASLGAEAEDPVLRIRLPYIAAQLWDLLSHIDPWNFMANAVAPEEQNVVDAALDGRCHQKPRKGGGR